MLIPPRSEKAPHVSATATPILDGWFTTSPPALLGQRCAACAATVFPPRATTCPNPACRGDELEQVALARTGTIWSWATNHYPPPPPYVPADPYVPTTVVAVELDGEAITVLGQLDEGDDPTALWVGMPVEVVVGELGSEDGTPRSTYRFRVRADAEVSP